MKSARLCMLAQLHARASTERSRPSTSSEAHSVPKRMRCFANAWQSGATRARRKGCGSGCRRRWAGRPRRFGPDGIGAYHTRLLAEMSCMACCITEFCFQHSSRRMRSLYQLSALFVGEFKRFLLLPVSHVAVSFCERSALKSCQGQV